MVELSYHPQAEAEIQAAAAWYLSRSQAAAVGLTEELDRVMAMIEQFPELHRPTTRGIGLLSCDAIRTAWSIGWKGNASV